MRLVGIQTVVSPVEGLDLQFVVRHVADFFKEHGAPRIETVAYTEYNTLFGQFFTDLMAGEEDVQGLTTEYAELMDEAASKYAE